MVMRLVITKVTDPFGHIWALFNAIEDADIVDLSIEARTAA